MIHLASRPAAPAALALALALVYPAPEASAQTAGTASGASLLSNLEPQLPAEVEDAQLTPHRAREVQLPIRLRHERDGDSRFLVEPRFQMGLLPDLQATLALPLLVGSSDRTNSGNLRGDLLYKFTDESRGGLWPAIAGGFGVELPTGTNAAGADTYWRLVATKTLGAQPGVHQIHGNLIYRHNDDPRPGERDDTSRFIIGYSTPLSPAVLLVADVVRGHGRLGSLSMQTIYEVGVRYLFTPTTALAFGFATGNGPDSPEWQLTTGFQARF